MFRRKQEKVEHQAMSEFLIRLLSRIKRELAYYGLSKQFQAFEYQDSSNSREKTSILIVAAGSVRIPTPEWGAVETIIAETIPVYLKNGISVGLLNSDNWFEWRNARKYSYSVIICHSDTHLRKVRKYWPLTSLIAVTHYGLAAQPTLWHPSYRKVFNSVLSADKVVCLSPAVLKTFAQLIPEEKLVQIGNGSGFTSKPQIEKTGSIVMVGKIEERKRQYELWKFAAKNNIDIRFIGPIQDPRVIDAMKNDDRLSDYFLGSKSKSELAAELPQYKAILLLSEGEADALVLYEAQFAGLEVITNIASLGSQNPDLPWVHIVEDFEDLKRVIKEVSHKPVNPTDISDYANKHYRWDTKLNPLIDLVKEISSNEE